VDLQARVSEEVGKRVLLAAAAEGLSVSAWVRRLVLRALGGPIREKPNTPEPKRWEEPKAGSSPDLSAEERKERIAQTQRLIAERQRRR
jgi:hypothetical protein